MYVFPRHTLKNEKNNKKSKQQRVKVKIIHGQRIEIE